MTSTIVVWTLIFFVQGYKSGGPTVIDNISSEANCQALLRNIQRAYLKGGGYTTPGTCVAVRKVRHD